MEHNAGRFFADADFSSRRASHVAPGFIGYGCRGDKSRLEIVYRRTMTRSSRTSTIDVVNGITRYRLRLSRCFRATGLARLADSVRHLQLRLDRIVTYISVLPHQHGQSDVVAMRSST